MKVSIASEAVEFIKAKTDTITVRLEYCGGWGGTTLEPAVYAGQPREEDGYSKTEAEGLTVFVPEDVPVRKEGLDIRLIGFGPFRQLVVEGFRV